MIISWNSTNMCNMFCDHCYRESGRESSGELNTQEAKKLIDEIKKSNFKIMIFSGGEPLMRKDIVELVDYASYAGLSPVLGSNGTLLTHVLASDLKKAGAKGIGISLDSLNSEKHDKLRKYEGAWDEAVLGMDHCLEVGLKFQIHTTVMKWNSEEIVKISDFALKKRAAAHHIFFLVPTGRAINIEDKTLKAEEYESLIKEILLKQKEIDIEIKPTCAPQFMRIARELNINNRFTKGCLAGISYCIISPTGNVQPCAYLDIIAGNVREKAFDEIWHENNIFKRLRSMKYSGKCGKCEYSKICGGCRARAYYYTGDYMAEEPWCQHQVKGCC